MLAGLQVDMNRFRADLVLLSVALIWGSAFTVQRVATHYFDTFSFNGLRFLLGGLVLFPFSQMNPLRKSWGVSKIPDRKVIISHPLDRKSILYMVLAGLMIFGAAGLQQVGLQTTTAGNAGFLTTLYVVLVPVILTVFWKEKIHWISWLGAGIAIIGSLLLSTGGSLHLATGDILVMISAILWALHVIIVSRAVRHVDVVSFSSGQYLTAGVLNILVSICLRMSLRGLEFGWWTILYIGLLSTAVGYTLQVVGQKYAPPTDATILLSMEAVFAALTGFFFLGETMQPVQLLGCFLILTAVVVIQLHAVKPEVSPIETNH